MDNAVLLKEVKKWLGTGSINLFGLPYTGKDTQGRELARLLDTELLGGGDILRGGDIPDHVQKIMQTGELIPTDDYVQIVLPKLSSKELHGKPLILSSVGRWHGEEASVIKALRASRHALKVVVFLEMSEDAIHYRWQKSQEIGDRGVRLDEDSEEKIKTRLHEFATKTLPVINFYEEQGLLLRIDGDRPKEVVTHDILAAIALYASTHS